MVALVKEFNCDLQLHGPFAGGVSPNMLVPTLAEQGKLKGLHVLSTADVQHAKWLEHLKQNVIEIENGVFTDKNQTIHFLVGTEVEDRNRVHHLIYLPDFSVAAEFREKIKPFGNLDCSLCGRPIIRLSPEKIAEIVVDLNGIIGSAHSFTPYTGLFSKYDSVAGAYGKMASKILFLELGLSADTHWADLISANHSYAFLSSSDAHCIHPDTAVFMANGEPVSIKKIENLNCISMDFESGEASASVPFAIMKKKAPTRLYQIECRTKQIKVTAEHRFFVFEERGIKEKFAHELKAGDLLATLQQIPFGEKNTPLKAPAQSHYFKINSEGLSYLKNKRKAHSLTCIQMEAMLEMPNDYLWRLEKGQYKMKEETLNTLLSTYQIKKETFTTQFDIQKTPLTRFPASTNPELCQIMGYVLGDRGQEIGRKGRQLGITDKNPQLLAEYQKLFESQFGITRRITPYSSQKSFRIRFNSATLDFFKQNFPTLLVQSPQRTIPSFVFDLPTTETGAFLRGLFDAEGSIGHHHIDLASSHEFLLKQVQSLLLKFGIESSLQRNLWEKTKKKFRHRLYIYDNRDLRAFLEHIGFASDVKRQKVEKYLKTLKGTDKSSFVDYLPIEKEIARIITEMGLKKAKYRLDRFLYRKEKLRKKTAQKFIAMLENDLVEKTISSHTNLLLKKIKTLAFSDISWQPIQKVQSIPSDCEYVYDLSVPGYENYIAEGLVVHNSPWPHRIGREFNRIQMKKPCFSELKNALEEREEKKIVLNAGLDPREGKYHETACNNCFAHFSMQQAEQFKWLCPNCRNPIKKGVRDRIVELADLKEEKHPKFRPPYLHLLPLAEIIQQSLGIENVLAKSVQSKWKDFVERFENEIAVLVDVPESELMEFDSRIAKFVLAFRNGWVHYSPGGGGEYGKPFIALSKEEFEELKRNPPEKNAKKNNFRGQKTLGEYG